MASKNGSLVPAAYRFAQSHRRKRSLDVPVCRLRGNVQFGAVVLAVPGQGSGLSLRYFWHGCGRNVDF